MANQETKKVLTIVDRSTKALNAAAQGISDIVAQVAPATALLSQLASDIEFKQSELENLESTYADKVKNLEADVANKARSLEADLALQVKENKQKVLATLMSELGLANITKVDLSELQKDFEYAQREVTQEIADAVAKAVGAERSKAAQDLATQAADHKVAIAKYEANESAKDTRIEELKSTIEDLRKQQDKDREAQVKIAEARSGETTNFNVGK